VTGPETDVALPRVERRRRLGWMQPSQVGRHVVAIAVVVLVLTTLLNADASAGPVVLGKVARHGDCTGVSSWHLRVVALATSELRVRFLIVGGEEGQTWNIFLDRDGVGFFAGSRDSSIGGLVKVRRRIADLPGEELIRVAGHNVVTGEVCRGRVRARIVQ
jgi:hypothetical protein